MNFARLFTVLVFVFIGLIVAILAAYGEDFAEKLLPLFMVGAVLAYILMSLYLGYFFATQKPPQELIILAVVVIVISFLSGYFMGAR